MFTCLTNLTVYHHAHSYHPQISIQNKWSSSAPEPPKDWGRTLSPHSTLMSDTLSLIYSYCSMLSTFTTTLSVSYTRFYFFKYWLYLPHDFNSPAHWVDVEVVWIASSKWSRSCCLWIRRILKFRHLSNIVIAKHRQTDYQLQKICCSSVHLTVRKTVRTSRANFLAKTFLELSHLSQTAIAIFIYK